VKQREVNSIRNLIELSSSLLIEGFVRCFQVIERGYPILAIWVLVFLLCNLGLKYLEFTCQQRRHFKQTLFASNDMHF